MNLTLRMAGTVTLRQNICRPDNAVSRLMIQARGGPADHRRIRQECHGSASRRCK